MNLFGVLKFKKMGEDFVRGSGFPFTIIRFMLQVILLFSYCLLTSSSTGDGSVFLYFALKERISGCVRAGRLTDGPYTSYDLNTLLKATAGQRRAVLMGQGNPLL